MINKFYFSFLLSNALSEKLLLIKNQNKIYKYIIGGNDGFKIFTRYHISGFL